MSDAHHPALHHHFKSLEQQRQSSSFGMWVFIAQEIMFFGGLFLGYTVYRFKYPAAFAAASHELSIFWGSLNTVFLIGSSLTVALAVHAAQEGKVKRIVQYIIATLILGSLFLGVKYIEYSGKWEYHRVPGKHFHVDLVQAPAPGAEAAAPAKAAEGDHGAAGKEGKKGEKAGKGKDSHTLIVPHNIDPEDFAGQVQIFYCFYFVMTGMHALHMIIGIGLMFWLLKLAAQRRFSANYYAPVELFGLYWHFVDVIWIFLFPLLYLIGRHVS